MFITSHFTERSDCVDYLFQHTQTFSKKNKVLKYFISHSARIQFHLNFPIDQIAKKNRSSRLECETRREKKMLKNFIANLILLVGFINSINGQSSTTPRTVCYYDARNSLQDGKTKEKFLRTFFLKHIKMFKKNVTPDVD